MILDQLAPAAAGFRVLCMYVFTGIHLRDADASTRLYLLLFVAGATQSLRLYVLTESLQTALQSLRLQIGRTWNHAHLRFDA